jgi:hypothetical protein
MATESKPSDLSEQAMVLAEQLGRLAGTVEGTAEAWLKNPGLADQLARVRDGAAELLKSLTKGKTTGKRKKAGARSAVRATRKVDPARAPGKKRRKPAPSLVGVKKSDERIPKMRSAAAVRQRRKSYA